MARTARTDAPINAVGTIFHDTLTDVLNRMVGTGNVTTVAIRKADGTTGTYRGTVESRKDTGRGVRFILAHADGFATVDPCYLIVDECAFTG